MTFISLWIFSAINPPRPALRTVAATAFPATLSRRVHSGPSSGRERVHGIFHVALPLPSYLPGKGGSPEALLVPSREVPSQADNLVTPSRELALLGWGGARVGVDCINLFVLLFIIITIIVLLGLYLSLLCVYHYFHISLFPVYTFLCLSAPYWFYPCLCVSLCLSLYQSASLFPPLPSAPSAIHGPRDIINTNRV